MEAVCPSEMLVFYHITTWYHNPEDHYINLQCNENLKSLIIIILYTELTFRNQY